MKGKGCLFERVRENVCTCVYEWIDDLEFLEAAKERRGGEYVLWCSQPVARSPKRARLLLC